jgi:hypothetical protein
MAGTRYQPQGRLRPNISHPLGRTLAEAWLPGISSRGIVSGADSSTIAEGSRIGTPYGVGFSMTSTGRRYSTTILNGQQCAWLIIARRSSENSNCSVVRKDGTVTPMQDFGGTVRVALFNSSGSGYSGSIDYGASAEYVNRVSTFCGAVSPTGTYAFSNGGVKRSNGSADIAGPSTNPLCIGASESGSEIASVWTVLAVFLWQGAGVPSEAALRDVERNPYQLIAFDDDDECIGAVAGPKQYTLSAAVGSFGLVGVSGSLRASRRLPAASASFATAGASASLLARRRLPAASGVLAISGSAASLRAARALAAGPGALALAGAPAQLRAARRLPAALGVFALAGADAQMRATRKLQAGAGVFALAGNAISMTYVPAPGPGGPTYTLAAASGAFGLAGMQALLRAARLIQAAPNAFALSGISAQLRAARRLAATAGPFGLTGAAASLRAARRLPAASGAFALTGNSIGMVYTPIVGPGGPMYILAANSGSFGLAGAPAMLRAQRRLSGAPGALAVSGTSAEIMVSRRLAAGPGSLVVQGAQVGLSVARRIRAGAGAFSLVGAEVQLRYSAKIEYASAPAGSGYTPHQHYNESRPVATSSPRPSATQRNFR